VSYDVVPVRAQYPALGDGRAWLDGAAGTQVPQAVIDAVSDAYRSGVSNQGAPFEASVRGAGIVAEARQAVADLVGAPEPRGVVLGPTMTALTYRFAAALAPSWRPGDEIVLTQLDHDANVRPWVQAAERAGVTVRLARVDPTTGQLPAAGVVDLIGPRTRLVALTAASNLIGTRPDVAAVCSVARAAGAVSYIDGVHHCPHTHVDLATLGADLYATSAYKWTGPHLAAVVAADLAVLEALHPDTLLPSPDTVPERFELGTSPFPSLAGLVAAVDHLAGLDPAATGTRRQRLALSRTAASAHEDRLGQRMLDGLMGRPGVALFGPLTNRTPTAYFRLEGLPPADVAAELGARGVNCWSGYAYAWELAGALGLRETGGGVRASVSHYSDDGDVDRLLAAVAELAG
jgi:cysteine desulfurase family protein (TIGR01976 family)